MSLAQQDPTEGLRRRRAELLAKQPTGELKPQHPLALLFNNIRLWLIKHGPRESTKRRWARNAFWGIAGISVLCLVWLLQ
jgi:hypothetical protein